MQECHLILCVFVRLALAISSAKAEFEAHVFCRAADGGTDPAACAIDICSINVLISVSRAGFRLQRIGANCHGLTLYSWFGLTLYSWFGVGVTPHLYVSPTLALLQRRFSYLQASVAYVRV